MNEKEKAKELVYKFKKTHPLMIKTLFGNLVYPFKSGRIGRIIRDYQAKQCALICVDEMIIDWDNITSEEIPLDFIIKKMEYLEGVKREIELL